MVFLDMKRIEPLKVINYSFRGLILVLGVLFLTGLVEFTGNRDYDLVMGIIFVMFGLYRLLTYHSQQKRHYYNDTDD